jgi:hypothetical protein
VTATLATLAGLFAATAGVWMLRQAWARPGGRWRVAVGWIALAAGAPGWRIGGMGWDEAVALAALTPSLAGLAILAPGLWPRPAKTQRARRIEPSEAVVLPAWRRGLLQGLMAGPLAGLAAVGLATAWAAHAPFADTGRVVVALFLLPLLWAIGAVWATSDGRLVRVGAGLALAAAAGFGVAAL